MYALANLSLVPVRKDPSDKSEMVSQLLFGDMVEVIDKKESWLKTVDGAKFISLLFKTASGNKFVYRKVEHGTWLTVWLLENDPAHIAELCDYVLDLTGQYRETK